MSMKKQIWAADMSCMCSMLAQKVLSRYHCEPHRHNCMNVPALRTKVIRSSWGGEGTCIHLQEIMTDCVGSAFLCTDQVSVTDLLKQLHCNKHHTCRSFSRHTESVKQVYSEQWEGWDGEKVKFVWVREALDQLGSQIRRGGSGCLWPGGSSEGLLIQMPPG